MSWPPPIEDVLVHNKKTGIIVTKDGTVHKPNIWNVDIVTDRFGHSSIKKVSPIDPYTEEFNELHGGRRTIRSNPSDRNGPWEYRISEG